MMLGDHVVGGFNVSDQNVAVLDIDTELLLQGLVHMDGCLNISITALVAPVSCE